MYHLFIPDELILLNICIINNYSSVYAIHVEEETIKIVKNLLYHRSIKGLGGNKKSSGRVKKAKI